MMASHTVHQDTVQTSEKKQAAGNTLELAHAATRHQQQSATGQPLRRNQPDAPYKHCMPYSDIVLSAALWSVFAS